MPEVKKSFWGTLPGILTAITGLVTAVGSIYLAMGGFKNDNDDKMSIPEDTIVNTKSVGMPVDQWTLAAEEYYIDNQAKWPSGGFESKDGFDYLNINFTKGVYQINFACNKGTSRYFDSPYGAALNFRMEVDLKMAYYSSNDIMAGVHFGYSQGVGYLFNILGNGKWGVHKTDNFDKPIVEWTNSTINPKDWNRIKVEIDDSVVRLRINSIIVGEFVVNDYKGGIFGFYIASNDVNGNAIIEYDNFEFYRKK